MKIQIKKKNLKMVCRKNKKILNAIFFLLEKQLSTNAIYVGQLPEHVVQDDIKKLFPKANKIELCEPVDEEYEKGSMAG